MPYSWNGSVEQVNGIADFVFYWGRFYCWANLEITSHYEHVSPETDPITTSSATERPSVATRSSHLKMGWYEKNLRNHSTFTRFKSSSGGIRSIPHSRVPVTLDVRCAMCRNAAKTQRSWPSRRMATLLLESPFVFTWLFRNLVMLTQVNQYWNLYSKWSCQLLFIRFNKNKIQRRWIIFWWTNNCAVTKSSSDASGWNQWLVIDQSVTCFYCGSFIWISAIFW